MQPEFIIPRNERDLAELFEVFLFGKTEEFSDFEPDASDKKFKLDNKDLSLLHKTGVVNRIFRRWFQTTFGHQSWTKAFHGETPRQEFSHHLSEFKNGGALFCVEMKQMDNKWKIIPKLLLEKDVRVAGGIFMYGLKNMKASNLNPYFDFEFEKFAEYMKRTEKIAQMMASYSPPENEEEKWWRLFWSQVGISLSSNIGLELPDKEKLKIGIEFQDCLDGFVEKQGTRDGYFIDIDELFKHLWVILMNTDDRLASLDEMNDKDERREGVRMNEEPDFLYSTKVFYFLGHMFDEKILFPADRYFGGVECVWTDINHFMNTMGDTVLILKNKLVHPALTQKTSAQEKEQMEYMRIPETSFNIEKTWLCPPTSFRILPTVKKYF